MEKLNLIKYDFNFVQFYFNMEPISVRITEAVEKEVCKQGWGSTQLLPRVSSIPASICSVTQLQKH